MKAGFSRLAPILGLALGSSLLLAATAPQPGAQALDYGFRFASAIHADPKDQQRAQEAVVLDIARSGDLAGAARRAESISGWRRGTVYADLASMFADSGNAEMARTLIQRAEDVRASIDGWQSQRINAHLAQALAKVGDAERATSLTANVATNDPRQYAGRAAATEATGMAVQGQFDSAMIRLSALDASTDFDVTWWRTLGYVELARQAGLKPGQREAALFAARRSADGIDGWKRAEALQTIAELFLESGKRVEAIEALEAGEPLVRRLPSTTPVKAAVLSHLAGTWAALDNRDHARELLAVAEQEALQTLVIDIPGLLAEIASGHLALGNRGEATRLYDAAFAAAEELVNARPRALAVVEICRSLGRSEVSLTEAHRNRLDALYAGLRAPW